MAHTRQSSEKREISFTINRLREYRNALITDYMNRHPHLSATKSVEDVDNALKLVSSGLKNVKKSV